MNLLHAALTLSLLGFAEGWGFLDIVSQRKSDSEVFSKLLEVNNTVWGFDVKEGAVRHVDTSDIESLKVGKSVEMLEPVMGCVDGALLYVADMIGGLKVVDIKDKTNPKLVGTLRLRKAEGAATSVAAKNGYVYLFLQSPAVSSMYIIDATDPTSPVGVGKMNVNGVVRSCIAIGSNLHATTSTGLVLNFDITNPKLFNLRSSTPTGDVPTSISAFMEFIYVGVGTEIRAYLTLNPDSLEEALRLDVGSPVNDVLWYRGYLYAATDKGVAVVDVRDPRKGYQTGFRDTPSKALSVAIYEFKAIVSDKDGTLTVVETLPVAPKPVTAEPIKIPVSEVKQPVVVTTAGTDDGELTLDDFKDDDKPKVKRVDPNCMVTSNPNIRFDISVMKEGTIGWANHNEAAYDMVPKWLQGTTAYVPPIEIKKGTELRVPCCSPYCFVYLYLEHCPPCTSKTNGGLPAYLLTEGWHANSCGPSFRVSADKASHRMVIFKKVLHNGEIESIPIVSKSLKFAGVAVANIEKPCKEITSKADCQDVQQCNWDDISDTCNSHFRCEKEKRMCDKCASDDLEFE